MRLFDMIDLADMFDRMSEFEGYALQPQQVGKR
jgi:hypothetical protein